ncbi:PIN domain-containing protein [Candidatus Parabeggiatoa sp. HSG14]|uniref:type II toxin-antitoxin system VapC family toxin n=1 Tax=Candidatus Parabeggiatoa sp. HSG14 TaxID=3055593 RepID=UPI0025A8EDC2|nr:PIN domain-containing protein [Thiotrichales bacterium HSG14]
MKQQDKKTFLDTGVLIKAFQSPLEEGKKAFNIVAAPDRKFVVSDLLKLELLPKARFHKQSKEIAFYEDFFKSATLSIEINSALVEKAIALASEYDLAPCDALHLSAAIEAKVDEFITTEKPTKPFFRVQKLDFQIISLYVPPSKSDKSKT